MEMKSNTTVRSLIVINVTYIIAYTELNGWILLFYNSNKLEHALKPTRVRTKMVELFFS